ncbi:ABC transporter permease [Kutzneria buriramensis]|uniref:Putative ABC transport system permease protein n=1 Tax=Kutzneria buriramensis TaxID=1045776 RepID=A0A3E0HZW1_9PSEU|nr:ABC transporter permease [Kutzneria buriramensis]REH51993.1 putative ABC transport system permease protein [Kutzneria buriramensis]
MFRATLAGLRARTARMVLSSIAIILGVAFVSGTLILGNALNQQVHDEFARQAKGVDVSVGISHATNAGDNTKITQDTIDSVRKIPGVAGADARGGGDIAVIKPNGKAASAFVATIESTPQLQEFDLVSGAFPKADNEIGLDERTAKSLGLGVGQKISVLGPDDKPVPLTVSGTYSQGSNSLSLSDMQVLLTPSALSKLDKQSGLYQIVAAAAPGVSQQELADRISAQLGKAFSVQTGDAFTQDTLQHAGQGSGGLTQFMLIFALISLVVASMVIYNTFTILVAQRTRELALLRCIGAERRQVFGSVLLEAFVMGLVASVIGLAAGIGLAALLEKAIGWIDGSATSVSVPMTASVVIAAFAIGVLVTVVSAVLPALRATKVAPLAALRSQLDTHDDVRRTGVLRIISAAVLLLGGAGIIGLGMGLKDQPNATLFTVGGGTMVMLLGVIVLGPLIVGPVNKLLGALPSLLFGVPAKLATANAGRNPRRTAATTAALVIGVTIVTMVTVVANSGKQAAAAQVDKRFPADFVVKSSVYDHALPADLATNLRSNGKIAQVAPSQMAAVNVGQIGDEEATGIDPSAIGTMVNPKMVSGDLHQLGPGTVALNKQAAGTVKLGDQLVVSTPDGNKTLKLVAVYDAQQLTDVLVTLDTLTSVAPKATGYYQILVKVKPGVSTADGQAVMDQATANIAVADVTSAAATKDQLNSQIDSLLGLMWALIGLAVVIALFGIANTLGLSVLERTRESALLRALGLTKGQLRLMLVIESVLMGVMGALIGVVLGGAFAWVLIEALSNPELQLGLAIPGGQLGVLLLAAVIAAVLAALMPARRAARMSIVAGMAEA